MTSTLRFLITSAKYFDELNAELFGFWYYKDRYLPSSVVEKQKIFHDLMQGRCIQLALSGSFRQVLDLLRQSDGFKANDSKSSKHFNALCDAMQQNPNRDISFENITKPRGSSFSLLAICELDETSEKIQRKIKEVRDSVKLQIGAGWDVRVVSHEGPEDVEPRVENIGGANKQKQTDKEIADLIHLYIKSNYSSFIKTDSLVIGRAIIPIKMLVDTTVRTFRLNPTIALENVIEYNVEYFQS